MVSSVLWETIAAVCETVSYAVGPEILSGFILVVTNEQPVNIIADRDRGRILAINAVRVFHMVFCFAEFDFLVFIAFSFLFLLFF